MKLDELRDELNKVMLASLPVSHPTAELDKFYQLIRDYPLRQGKQLRGLFVLLACEAHGGDWRHALPVAAALELFQNWVLIHDDIEDDSEERRGGPALHKQVGLPVALNVGDALHVYMWQLLHELTLPKATEIRREFLRMIHRTAEGQHLDLSWVQSGRFDIREAEYLQMVTLKTAYYTVVSPLILGAYCAAVSVHPSFEEAGKALGIAFQIRDDVLNLLPGDSYGKEFAGDLYEAKRTLILSQLFGSLNADTKVEVIARLSKSRQQRSSEDVAFVLGLIDQQGSLSYAQTIAEQHAAQGLALLQNAFASLPNQAVATELFAMLESLAYRHN